jgi:hypothetical protein
VSNIIEKGVYVDKYGAFNSEFRQMTGKKMRTGLLEERIISQKIAYLLHRRGISSTYHGFKWYLHGVFSFELWYDTIHSPDIEEPIDAAQVEKISLFQEECSEAGIFGYFGTSAGLELITTILYFAKSREDLREDNGELVSRVQRAKSKFSDEEEIKAAIGKMRGIPWEFQVCS